MAHATKCPAPEGNRGRDEWTTVIEVQEYMGASRGKAYDLIWSGEIDSYRLGRKLLVSRASVDAYIESSESESAPDWLTLAIPFSDKISERMKGGDHGQCAQVHAGVQAVGCGAL